MRDASLPIGRRVLVTGMAGSGKSTFSRSLAAKTGLPVIHLDFHFWKQLSGHRACQQEPSCLDTEDLADSCSLERSGERSDYGVEQPAIGEPRPDIRVAIDPLE